VFAVTERKSAKGKAPIHKKGEKPQIRVDRYQESLSEPQWEKVFVRNTAKGPKYVFAHTVAVWHWDSKEDTARRRTLVITKTCGPDPQIKYSFSNGTVTEYKKKNMRIFSATVTGSNADLMMQKMNWDCPGIKCGNGMHGSTISLWL